MSNDIGHKRLKGVSIESRCVEDLIILKARYVCL